MAAPIARYADPAKHHLLLIGELNASDPYHAQLLAQAASPPWKGHVTLRGFAEPQTAARYLACADAAVFPFAAGGGVWNSSVHAAMAQGTFTLVTSRDRSGYAEDENTYYAKPGAIAEMKEALERYAGARRTPDSRDEWQAVASHHVQIYRAAAQRGSRK